MTVRHIVARMQAHDLLGVPAPGAKLRFYDPGTTSPRIVYADSARAIPILQPIIADIAGFFPQIYLQDGTYKYTLHSSTDVLLDTEDNVDPGLSTGAGALAIAAGGTGATTAAGARANLSVPSQSAFDALDLRVADAEALLDNPILAPSVSVTFAASLTVDFTADETRHVTLTGNITTLSATVTEGQDIRLYLAQDATGSRTWVVDTAVYKFPGNVVPPLSTTANAIDVLEGHVRSGVIHVTSFKRQDPLVPIAIFEDQKSSGTDGGTFTSGADRTRTINTEVSDPCGFASVSSNQISLLAGTYLIEWSAPALVVDSHQAFLYNATDAAVVQRGSTEQTDTSTNVATRSRGSAIVTIASTKAFEIRHRCDTTRSTDGFGRAGSFGTEVYTQVVIRRFP